MLTALNAVLSIQTTHPCTRGLLVLTALNPVLSPSRITLEETEKFGSKPGQKNTHQRDKWRRRRDYRSDLLNLN